MKRKRTCARDTTPFSSLVYELATTPLLKANANQQSTLNAIHAASQLL